MTAHQNPDLPNSATRFVLPPDEEPPREACLGLLYHLLRFDEDPQRGSVGDRGKQALRRNLLLADYARRSADLHPLVKAHFDRYAVESLGAGRRPQAWRELRDSPQVAEPVDVAILTVLPEELAATKLAFGAERTPQPRDNQPVYTAKIKRAGDQDQSFSVVITQTAKPLNVHTFRPVAQILDRYLPTIIFLVGIAAGNADKFAIGDVVVPRKVFYYEPERLTIEGIKPRPEHTEPDDDYLYGFTAYDQHEGRFADKVRSFFEELPTYRRPDIDLAEFQPRVVSENTTIATGERVLRDGEYLAELRDRFDETICAADQESYGFAEATRSVPWLIFRGISDHADPVQRDNWKYVAAGAAALCLRDFLERDYLPPDLSRF